MLAEVKAKYEIPESLILIWQPKIRTLTKAPASIPVSSLFSKGNWGDEEDNLKQAVYIGGDNMDPKPIFEVPDSLIAQLANKALFSYRVYMVPTEKLSHSTDEIKKAIEDGIAG